MFENLNLLFYGFASVFTFNNILACLFGTIAGVFIGAMPGIGALTGVAVLLPITFAMNPASAIIMLAAVYYACAYGGSISAVLLNIPGDTPAICTALDGYPLTKKGMPGKALTTCFMSSFIGGTIGILILTVSGPMLARIGLNFGSPELALLILLALTSIGWLLGDNVIHGLLATSLGVLFATVGTDYAAGYLRFHFGIPNLMAGVAFVPLVIGMFGFSQVIEMVTQRGIGDREKANIRIQDMFLTWGEVKRILPVQVRCGLLGTFVGVMPGAGSTSAAFLAYIMERRINRNGSKFTKGVIEGCAASEAANNSAVAGAFAPLLTLGIPGSSTTAILLGGLMMWGLQPGPLLFTEKPDFVWPLIASFYLANVIGLITCFACIPLAMKAVSISNAVLAPIVFATCVVASYTTNNSMFDVYFMIGVGILSYFLKLSEIPTAPLLLAFVLSPMLEKYIRQSFDMTRGDPSIFIRNSICWILIALFWGFCFAPIIVKRVKGGRARKQSSQEFRTH
ncbi:MAG: tripartite tricarboxylate transporter permease [Spirochaetia bacterium]|jgi:putative tricarboxylic transport membrane protein|nr:tripartite tricarboxylate transporter permease [Spirochaetia bacterium]